MVKKYFSDDSFDKIFDIETIKRSVKADSFTKYILITLLIFGILSILITIFLYNSNNEKKLK